MKNELVLCLCLQICLIIAVVVGAHPNISFSGVIVAISGTTIGILLKHIFKDKDRCKTARDDNTSKENG